MGRIRHENIDHCKKCAELFDRYPGFHRGLREWFEAWRAKYRTAHISCAGRGKAEQEEAFLKGTSKAHYTKSAHNWNAAIDIFGQVDGQYIVHRQWYDINLVGNIPSWTKWGATFKDFKELPHLELADWEDFAQAGVLHLVEPDSSSPPIP